MEGPANRLGGARLDAGIRRRTPGSRPPTQRRYRSRRGAVAKTGGSRPAAAPAGVAQPDRDRVRSPDFLRQRLASTGMTDLIDELTSAKPGSVYLSTGVEVPAVELRVQIRSEGDERREAVVWLPAELAAPMVDEVSSQAVRAIELLNKQPARRHR